ncbi:MAG: glycosyltransferase family 39 protein [Candidatus Omnitrophota bacterium]
MKKISFLITLAFIIRLASFLIMRNYTELDFLNLDEYNTIALNILSGKGFTYNYLNATCYFFGASPLYVYYLVFLHLITKSNYLAIEIIQIIISSLAIVPLYFITDKIFSKKVVFICVLLYIFHPVLIVFSVQDTALLNLYIFYYYIFNNMLKVEQKKYFDYWCIGRVRGTLKAYIYFLYSSILCFSNFKQGKYKAIAA